MTNRLLAAAALMAATMGQSFGGAAIMQRPTHRAYDKTSAKHRQYSTGKSGDKLARMARERRLGVRWAI